MPRSTVSREAPAVAEMRTLQPTSHLHRSVSLTELTVLRLRALAASCACRRHDRRSSPSPTQSPPAAGDPLILQPPCSLLSPELEPVPDVDDGPVPPVPVATSPPCPPAPPSGAGT